MFFRTRVSNSPLILLLLKKNDSCATISVVNSAFKTYYPGFSFIHKLDARIKIIALALITLGVFLVHSLCGMLVCACVLAVFMAMSRVPKVAWMKFLLPACAFALLPVVFNGISTDVYATQHSLETYYDVALQSHTLLQPIVIWNTGGIVLSGCLYGAMLGLRIVILIYASLLFTFTTCSNEIITSITWFLTPFARIGLPVRDVSLVFSLALCFIPVIAQEYVCVVRAQHCRGASTYAVTFSARMKVQSRAFVAVFVRLFRRAETLGLAMDARCYGMYRSEEK